jgi:hypothetical protein
MRSPRPAVAELALCGAIDTLAGAVIAAVAFDADRITGALVGLGITLAFWMLLARAQFSGITSEARPDTSDGEPATPGLIALAFAIIVAAGTIYVMAQNLPLMYFGVFILGIGFWHVALAMSLWRWEHKNGRRLMLRPVYRVGGTAHRGLGFGWFDPANFSTR